MPLPSPTVDESKFSDLFMLALCLWREARGESLESKRCVAWSIMNRVRHPSWWGGPSVVSVVAKPWQYSGMTAAGDPNLIKWPHMTDTSWLACLQISAEVYDSPQIADPTQGATHYFDKTLDQKPPYWAKDMTHVLDSGNFHFYKV